MKKFLRKCKSKLLAIFSLLFAVTVVSGATLATRPVSAEDAFTIEESTFATTENPISHWVGNATAGSTEQYVISETNGINMVFDGTDKDFMYTKPIDVTTLGSSKKFINFYVNMLGNRSVQVYVDLIDTEDASNYVSVRVISKSDGGGVNDTSLLACVPSIGQQYTGKIIGYSRLRVNSLKAGTRKYSNITVSDSTNTTSYAPIHFSYDNTSKQIALTTVDNDYTNASLRHIVADLDDTTTAIEYAYVHDGTENNGSVSSTSRTGYFDTAWGGFTSNYVNVRIRVEGTVSPEQPVEMYLTSIGNEAVDTQYCSWEMPETCNFTPVSHWDGSAQADYTISEVGGYNLKLEDAKTAFYYKNVDISGLVASKKFINFYVNPLGNRNVQIYVDLIDTADSSNYVSVKINSKDGSSVHDSSLLACVPSIGQQYTGRFIGQDAVRINSTSGTKKYSNITVSDSTNTMSYAPIHFSYDNTSKQIALTTVDNDYTNASLRHMVADLDDTTTSLTYYLHDGTVYNNKLKEGTRTGYFDTAWGGFSSNYVNVRIRVEGTVSAEQPVEMYLTEIGGTSIDRLKVSVAPYHTISMLSGASIRTTQDSEGIRFAAKLTTEEYNYYAEKDVEFGMLIIPTALLSGELTVDTDYADNTIVSKDDIYFNNTEKAYCYNVAMTGVPESYRTLELSARAYIKVDGVYYYADYCTNFHSRSMAQTAKLALENGWTSNDATATAYVKELAMLAGWEEQTA